MAENVADSWTSWVGALSSNKLTGMCRWVGLHFHCLTDYNAVEFSGILNSY